MRLELRHLRTLCAIAEAGSLGKAALALGFSQPAISTQLRRLEELLGATLFTRSSTGVELTSVGEQVVEQARDILARVDELERRPLSTVDGGALRLGGTITPVLAGLVARMTTAYPQLTVTVRSEYAIGALLQLLESQQIDAALVLDYPGRELRESPTIACRAYTTEPAFVALPANHRLADRVEVPLGELSQEAWFVTPDDGAGWPQVFYDACADAGFRPIRTHEFLDEKNMQNLVVAGLAVTVCQPTMKPISGMVIKPLQGSPIRLRQLLAWRRDGPAGALAATMHRLAAQTYRELIARTPHYHAWSLRQGRA
jgi:DNA-binding transcriptional LysR family regulator